MNNIFLSSVADAMGLDQSTKMMLWIGIAVYMGILLLIGFYSGKKVNSMKDFLVAGRRLPLWMATATLLATWFGAGSSMGVAATVYSDGIGGVLADQWKEFFTCDSLDNEILVKKGEKRTGNRSCNSGHLNGMGHPGAVVVTFRIQKHLGFMH